MKDPSISTDQILDTLVVGGGAAGIFAAIHAAQGGRSVLVLEGSPRTLQKVKISGGGRCNLTHNQMDPMAFVKGYPRGERELRGPMTKFGPTEMVAWLGRHGVQVVAEEDGRMFPASNRSQTIVDTLMGAACSLGVMIKLRHIVRIITPTDRGFQVTTNKGSFHARGVILATGGSPLGYRLAADLGHTLVDPVPSLFTFQISDDRIEGLSGTSYPAAAVELRTAQMKRPERFEGPVLVTHWGLSGPAVLKLSSFLARELHTSGYDAQLNVTWDRGFDRDALESFLSERRERAGSRLVSKHPPGIFTKKHWHRLCEVALGKQEARFSDLTLAQVEALTQATMTKPYQVTGKGEFKDEFVTAGGVELKEVDLRTMQSKRVPGLFFAGELLDIDGITGGFNFQNAWTSGYLAGCAARNLNA